MRKLSVLAILSVFSFGNISGVVKVDLDIASLFSEALPITATLMITHAKDEKIDASTIKLGTHPLQAELIREQAMSTNSNLVVSLYRITLPQQPKGYYVLEPVKVTVDGKVYQSFPRTYEVRATNAPTQPQAPFNTEPLQQPTPAPPPQTMGNGMQNFAKNTLFDLEAFLVGPEELYPGQRITVGYRYYFNTNLEMTKEELPLLEAEGFIKIGEKAIKAKEAEGITVQQIEQEIEGDKPGEYSFGPSLIEGKAYEVDSLGRKVYAKELLSSKVAPIPITVISFPSQDKPASFKGAVGNFNWQVSLNSPSTVNVDDEIDLVVEVTGEGNFDSVKIPELCCQPGMSGLFHLGNLPSVGEATDQGRRFHISLRPLSTAVKGIPPLEFSSFDPELKKYLVSTSDEIPLNVLPAASDASEDKALSPIEAALDEPQAPLQLEANAADIEVESLYPLKASDLENKALGTWWALLLIPFSLAALLFQKNLQKYLSEVKAAGDSITSEELFYKALSHPLTSSDGEELITKAFLRKLKEKGMITSQDINPEALDKSGITGEVSALLSEIQKRRYSQNGATSDEDLVKEAHRLFNALKNLDEKR